MILNILNGFKNSIYRTVRVAVTTGSKVTVHYLSAYEPGYARQTPTTMYNCLQTFKA